MFQYFGTRSRCGTSHKKLTVANHLYVSGQPLSHFSCTGGELVHLHFLAAISRCVFERFGTCDRQRIAPRLDHDLIARRSLEVHHAAPVKERYGTGQHTAHTQRRTGRHLASLNEWILTTTAGFERTALEVSKPVASGNPRAPAFPVRSDGLAALDLPPCRRLASKASTCRRRRRQVGHAGRGARPGCTCTATGGWGRQRRPPPSCRSKEGQRAWPPANRPRHLPINLAISGRSLTAGAGKQFA